MAGFLKALFGSAGAAPYTVLREESGYQVRSYPSRKWVSSRKTWTGETPDLTDTTHRSNLFQSLFRYISGTNQQQEKMAMTVPVTMEWVPDVGGSGGTYTMSFYVNEELQGEVAPPAPTEEGLFLEQRPDATVLVAGRGGYPSEADWNKMAADLRESAEKNGETGYDFSKFYRVGYNAPMQFWNRLNEVWFVKANEEKDDK